MVVPLGVLEVVNTDQIISTAASARARISGFRCGLFCCKNDQLQFSLGFAKMGSVRAWSECGACVVRSSLSCSPDLGWGVGSCCRAGAVAAGCRTWLSGVECLRCFLLKGLCGIAGLRGRFVDRVSEVMWAMLCSLAVTRERPCPLSDMNL